MAKSLRMPLRLGANATKIECKSQSYALKCNHKQINERIIEYRPKSSSNAQIWSTLINQDSCLVFILRLRPLNAF